RSRHELTPPADPIVLTTPRLLLLRWRHDDTDGYTAICAAAAVTRWIGNGRVRTREECTAAIPGFERLWNERGFGVLAIELKATGRMVGFVGFSVPKFLPEILPAVEIGWRLAADHWGQGLATEGARAMLAYGFDRVKLDRVV